MFASSGYFKSIPCHLFNIGWCERPYCHFRHVKVEEPKEKLQSRTANAALSGAQADTANSKGDDSYNLPTSSLQKTLNAIDSNTKSEKTAQNGKTKPSEEQVDLIELKAPKLIKSKPVSVIPQYNPTPLRELKRQKLKVKLGQSKYELALLQGPSSEQEYDPASNFSTDLAPPSKSNLPTYAKPLVGSKRRSDFIDDEEDDDGTDFSTKRAKNDEFAMDTQEIDYIPAIGTFSDDDNSDEGEMVVDLEDYVSDDNSEDSAEVEADIHEDYIPPDSEFAKKFEPHDIELPFEFTPEGFIKTDKPKAVEKTVEKRKFLPKKLTSKSSNSQKFNSQAKLSSSLKSAESVLKSFSERDNSSTCDDKSSKTDRKDTTQGKALSSVSDTKKSDYTQKVSREGNKKDKKTSKDKIQLNKEKEAHVNVKSDKIRTSDPKSLKKNDFDKQHVSVSEKNKPSKSQSDTHHSHSSKENRKIVSSSAKSSESKKKEKEKDTDRHSKDSKQKLKTVDRTASKDSHGHTRIDKHKDHKLEKRAKRDKVETNVTGKKSEKHNRNKDHQNKRKDAQGHHSKYKGEGHEKDSDKKRRRKSSESDKKKKILNLNVDLFGQDSDPEDVECESPSPPPEPNPEEADMMEDSFSTDILDEELQDALLNDSDCDFSDTDTYEECLKIFNESKGESRKSLSPAKTNMKKVSIEYGQPTVSTKTRVARKQDSECVDRRHHEVPKAAPARPSPAQVMMNRFKMMQQRALASYEASVEAKQKGGGTPVPSPSISRARTTAPPSEPVPSTSKSPQPHQSTSFYDDKKRVAHVPAKKSSEFDGRRKTTAVTASKKRTAHTPNVPIAKLKRPVLQVDASSKVPSNIRQRYLDVMIDECIKLKVSEKEAFKRGLDEELQVYNRGKNNKSTYLNLAVNAVKRLRSEVAGKSGTPSSPTKSPAFIGQYKTSHEAVLGGSHATRATYTVHRSGGAAKIQVENFQGAELYKRLSPYILTEEQLRENGFPLPHPEAGGTAIFYTEKSNKPTKQSPAKVHEKICVRCGKAFTVYPNGHYQMVEECVYHWGKAWKKKIAGSIETRYTCCQGDLASEGCHVCKAHVHEMNKSVDLTGYMKTIPCSPAIDGDYGVYAMDCEMVYTNMGMELARVTVIGPDLEPVYESLVKPDHKIMDYNTRFSGLTEEDLSNVTTTLRDAQAVLLSLFTDKTILIGHSLESDLTALKLLHDTVVDTSVVFPHRLGPPYKRALKTLMAEYLKKIIQDDVGGHDSKEDAVSCMELMHMKIKEDARKSRS